MSGQAMGGILAAVANLVTLSVGSHVQDSALFFFIFAVFMSICTLLGYVSLYYLVSKCHTVLFKLHFYKKKQISVNNLVSQFDLFAIVTVVQ